MKRSHNQQISNNNVHPSLQYDRITMGRVARYKKVKACDPYSKKNGGNVDLTTVGIWGLGDSGRRQKKKSLTAQRLKAKAQSQKNNNNKKRGRPDNHKNDDAANGFDLPPNEEDEFDMKDIVGSVKRQKVKDVMKDDNHNDDKSATATSTTKLNQDGGSPAAATTAESYHQIVTASGAVASLPKTDQDESKVARILKLDQQVHAKMEAKRQETQKRMEGESKRAYNKRSKAETRQIIQQTTVKKNVEKLQKKKEFLKNKKKKKKKGGGGGGGAFGSFQDSQDDDDDDDIQLMESSSSSLGLMTGERAVAAAKAARVAALREDPVLFGEQAERPPSFKHLPRGADKTKQQQHAAAAAVVAAAKKGMSNEEIDAERNAMELMRRKVQAQYAAIKSRRRQNGDFHL